MVVWASESPTQLKIDDQEVVIQPFEVVWFDNTIVFHRQPEDTNEQTRWFAAVRCVGEG
jgi:predicted HAD superfamily phosphohydrolase YqeG